MITNNVISFIDRVLGVNDFNNASLTFSITEHEIIEMIQQCSEIVLGQPVLLDIDPPLKICGDIHGQYPDLLRIFNINGDSSGYPPKTCYLFLGDYVDRGRQQLEVICLLMAYKVLCPDFFFITRGNHECSSINRTYGFYEECKRRYSVGLYNSFQGLFNSLPLCAIVGKRIFCMHGGLSPLLNNWSQLDDKEIRRPFDPPSKSLASDLLWSDPERNLSGWEKNSRGISFVFGEDVVREFCSKMDIDLIVRFYRTFDANYFFFHRGHQVVQDGYEFFADRRLVTVFSAPKYCGEFDNSAGIMTVEADLTCWFETLKPRNIPPRIRSKTKRRPKSKL